MKHLLLPLLLMTSISSVAAGREPLEDYVGKYSFPDGVMVKEVFIGVENGLLVMVSPLCSTILVRDSENNFAIPAFKGTAVFKRDANRKVINLTIAMQNFRLEGNKQNAELLPPATDPSPLILLWETKLG